jgi:hypothetical protein
MAGQEKMTAERDSYGALVGWTHREFAGRIDLRLELTQATGRRGFDDVEVHHVVMSPQQAAVLGHYLFQITGHTPPETRRKGRLARWFGS